MAFNTEKVDRPTLVDYDDYKIVKKGSHYVFSHAYQVNSKNQPIYKHIVLTQELENFKDEEPIRVVDRDIKLYKLETLIDDEKGDNEKCFKNIFKEDLIADSCSVDLLMKIKDTVIKGEGRGLINSRGDVIIYSEKNIVSNVGYRIVYLNPGFGEFLNNFTKFG